MSHTVDARGLSCPQPVILTLEEIRKLGKGQLCVIVDTDTSRENVSRAVESQGWRVEYVEPEGSGYRIGIVRN